MSSSSSFESTKEITCFSSSLLDNQKTVIQKFIDSNTSIYCGNIDNFKLNLLENLIDLHDNPIKLRNMSLNCKSFLNIRQNKINVLLDE